MMISSPTAEEATTMKFDWNEEADRLEYEADAASWPEADDEYERFTEERDAWLLEEEEGVKCDGCGIVCDAMDAVTDGAVSLCGSFRGNGCADKPGAWDYEDA
jgi:hypothetical protein